MKDSARPFWVVITAAIIMVTVAIAPVSAVSEDLLKLNLEKWVINDNSIKEFPTFTDIKSSKELVSESLIWSADSDDLSGDVPFCVRFAASVPDGLWDFGDKCYSGEQYHIHTYKHSGTYTATYAPKSGIVENVTITVTEPQAEPVKQEKDSRGLLDMFW